MTEALADPKTLNILETIKGRSYPSKDVKVWLDQETIHAIAELENEIAVETDGERVNELDEQIHNLREKVEKTALTFHLRGIDRRTRRQALKRVELLLKKGEVDEFDSQFLLGHLNFAAHLIRITDADGGVQEKLWTAEEAEEILDLIPEQGTKDLNDAMDELTFKAARFDAEVTPDFS